MEETDTVVNDVERVLTFVPSARRNNNSLLLGVWKLHGLVLTERQAKRILMMPSPETILRRRREIQDRREELRPTEEVIENRAQYRREIRQYYRKLADY